MDYIQLPLELGLVGCNIVITYLVIRVTVAKVNNVIGANLMKPP